MGGFLFYSLIKVYTAPWHLRYGRNLGRRKCTKTAISAQMVPTVCCGGFERLAHRHSLLLSRNWWFWKGSTASKVYEICKIQTQYSLQWAMELPCSLYSVAVRFICRNIDYDDRTIPLTNAEASLFRGAWIFTLVRSLALSRRSSSNRWRNSIIIVDPRATRTFLQSILHILDMMGDSRGFEPCQLRSGEYPNARNLSAPR